MKLSITGYSTALFSTWFFIEELGLLFDAGDGVTAGLLQKSRKVRHIFISHADRDHLTGLLQFNQLNAREGLPIIHYPAASGSFPALEAFSKNFDPHVGGTHWHPIVDGMEIEFKKNILVQVIKNSHMPSKGNLAKSFSFKVVEKRQKLKPAFAHLDGKAIKAIIDEKGRDFISEEIRTNILSYSGDTPVEDWERWQQSNILIHEATFLDSPTNKKVEPHGNKHSTLEEVMEMVAHIEVKQLILSHFSSRYSQQEIETAIKQLCDKYSIEIPVRCVLPGVLVRDILNQPALNQ